MLLVSHVVLMLTEYYVALTAFGHPLLHEHLWWWWWRGRRRRHNSCSSFCCHPQSHLRCDKREDVGWGEQVC
jgi:hypothetical protein